MQCRTITFRRGPMLKANDLHDVGCNREKFGGVGRPFAMLLVSLNCLLSLHLVHIQT